MSGPDGELREIRVLQFPLDVYERATEAFEGQRREFVLVAMRTPEAQDVPERLLQLVDALSEEFQGLNPEADEVRDLALGRGDRVVDELVYRMPAAAMDACVALNGMMDEADEFCRKGDVLLSLASPPEAVAFRRWYLGEITGQMVGESPLPWPEADIEALLRDPTLRGTSGR